MTSINAKQLFITALGASAALGGAPAQSRRLLDDAEADIPALPPVQAGNGLDVSKFPRGVFSTIPATDGPRDGYGVTVGRQPEGGNQTRIFAITCKNAFNSNSADQLKCDADSLDLSTTAVVKPSEGVARALNISTEGNEQPVNDALYAYGRIIGQANSVDCATALIARDLRASFGEDDISKLLDHNNRLTDHKARDYFDDNFKDDDDDIDIGCSDTAPASPRATAEDEA